MRCARLQSRHLALKDTYLQRVHLRQRRTHVAARLASPPRSSLSLTRQLPWSSASQSAFSEAELQCPLRAELLAFAFRWAGARSAWKRCAKRRLLDARSTRAPDGAASLFACPLLAARAAAVSRCVPTRESARA